MTCGISVVKGVPDDKVKYTIGVYSMDDPKPTVTKKKETDGTWTMTFDYGPCPDGTSPTTTTTHGS
jgi:hypothetical protein